MQIKFTKMQGTGNDYIYIDLQKNNIPENLFSQIAIKLSERHFGIGSDGVIFIDKSNVADCKMIMFNSDGSEGKMCGNGVRCVARYVYDNKYVNDRIVKVETKSGIKEIELQFKDNIVDNILVNMGKPIFKTSKIPVNTDKKELINSNINIMGIDYIVSCVSMGNPHCVIFMQNIDDLVLDGIGRRIEKNKAVFPEGVNVEFVEVIDNKNVKMRVWERGAGETISCGTGSCAVIAVMEKLGLISRDEEVNIHLIGGVLKNKYSSDGNIYMCGPAEYSFYGIYDFKEE